MTRVHLRFRRSLLLGLLFQTPVLSQDPDPVRVFHEQGPDNKYSLYVSTDVPCPIQVLVSFPTFTNLTADGPIPLDYIVVSQARRARMAVLTPTAQQISFKYETQWWIGDPETAKHDDNHLYRFPYRSSSEIPINQGYNGASTHQGEFALDFLLSEGSEVRAAREGTVVATKSDSRFGGPDPSFRQHANHVIIFHTDGSFAEYAHLKYNGVIVRRGLHVPEGALLGYSGNTGYSHGPHLHFCVRIPTYHSSRTIPTKFRRMNGEVYTPN